MAGPSPRISLDHILFFFVVVVPHLLRKEKEKEKRGPPYPESRLPDGESIEHFRLILRHRQQHALHLFFCLVFFFSKQDKQNSRLRISSRLPNQTKQTEKSFKKKKPKRKTKLGKNEKTRMCFFFYLPAIIFVFFFLRFHQQAAAGVRVECWR